MIATIVEVGRIVRVVLESLAATVAITIVFSLAVVGVARISERRHGGASRIAPYAALVLVSLCGCVGAVVYGVVLMARK